MRFFQSLVVGSLFAGVLAIPAAAQSAAFVMRLGNDTVQVERVVRTGNRLEGVVVVRTPTTRRINYTALLDAGGAIVGYEQWPTTADGSAPSPDPGRTVVTISGDSVTRESGPAGNRTVLRAAAPAGAVALGTIPVGTPFGIWEAAIGRLRGKGTTAGLSVNRIQAGGGQLAVMRTPVLHSSADSVEMDYFGQGRAGFKFDRDGRLIRSDWSRTTYQVSVVRIDAIDLEGLAGAWAAQEKGGAPFGRLSTRDTVRATVGTANVWLEYGRPSKRGRRIWGAVVPYDAVWRLGADQATQFRTDVDVIIGDVTIPAGMYTLWMVPGLQRSELVVSNLVGVFGTGYNPAKDFARIPLTRAARATAVERLTLSIRDGEIVIAWDDAEYRVPIRERR